MEFIIPQKGYKYRLYLEPDKVQQLNQIFGSVRHVWNNALNYSIKAYEDYKTNPELFMKPGVSGYYFARWLTSYKADHDWLYEISNVALQQKCLDLGKAFSSFFGKGRKAKTGYPKFKKKGYHESFRLTSDGFRLKDNQLYIAKCATYLNVRWSRELPSEPSSCTISRNSAGEYYVSFVCEYQPQPTNGQEIIGIDLGLTDLATISNGQIIRNPRYFKKAQCRLARLQRRLFKAQKGSNNREKARLKVAKQHQHIANQRKDYLHKVTTRLIRNSHAIAIEDLKVVNMSRNHNLAKHILDAGWVIFRKQLEYKASDSQHCRIIVADPWYPSTQLCSICGRRPQTKIKFGIKNWVCECGAIHNRDSNASKNLEQLAHIELVNLETSGITAAIIKSSAYIKYY